MKYARGFLILLTAFAAFGCSTAVINVEEDAGSTGVDTAVVAIDASSAQGADVSNTQSADVSNTQQIDTGSNTQPQSDCAAITIYHDADGDGYGDDATAIQHCADQAIGSGWVMKGGDCDDSDPAKNESCGNGAQADAGSSSVDANINPDVGAESPFECQSNDDCNKGLACTKYECLFGAIKNGVQGSVCSPAKFQEVCDGIDNDCDGITDNVTNPAFLQTYYEDKDGDGFGNPNKIKKACSKPDGYVVTGTDCDDTDKLTHPGALELCDGKDNNCNGAIDDGVKLITYYVDEDNDGYGSDKDPLFPPTTLCDNGYQAIPSYYVPNKSDCNDKSTSVHPGAEEVCDGKDNNCNWLIDEGCSVIGHSSFNIEWSNTETRAASLEAVADESQFGNGWDLTEPAVTSETLEVDLGIPIEPPTKCNYIRIDVAYGDPAYGSLCKMNGANAVIDPDAQFEPNVKVLTWSEPNGSGCSIRIALQWGGCILL